MISTNEFHIWQANLDDLRRSDTVSQYLSVEELQRAEKFHFRLHQDRFRVSRGLLRLVLSDYTKCDPRDLVFESGPFGKPNVIRPSSAAWCQFNVSHSHDHWAMVITRSNEVGVDIERIRNDIQVEELAREYFSASEAQALLALAPRQRRRAFFAVWTRKEAVLKMMGWGLSVPLDRFTVSIDPDEPATLVEVDSNLGEARRCELHDLALGCNIAGAVAVNAHDARLTHRQVTAGWIRQLQNRMGR